MRVGGWSHALSRAGRQAHRWLARQGSMPRHSSAWTEFHATAAAPASAARPPAVDPSAAARLSAAHPAPPEARPQIAISKATDAPASAACKNACGFSAEAPLCAACPAPPEVIYGQSAGNTPQSACFCAMSEASGSLSCIAPPYLLNDNSHWQKDTQSHHARGTAPYVPAASRADAGVGSLHKGGSFSGDPRPEHFLR